MFHNTKPAYAGVINDLFTMTSGLFINCPRCGEAAALSGNVIGDSTAKYECVAGHHFDRDRDTDRAEAELLPVAPGLYLWGTCGNCGGAGELHATTPHGDLGWLCAACGW